MIKKLSIISIFGMLSFTSFQAQTTVYAYLKDAQGKPIESAAIDLKDSENDVTADKIGYFQFVDMKPGHYQLTISKPGFDNKIIEFDVASDEKRKDLGAITLLVSTDHSELGVITVDDSESKDDDNGSTQPTVGLLNSGRDVFERTAAFELGAYWFRPRGVDNRYETVLFNGTPMSKNDDGKVDFSDWGGLNDVTRYPLENVENIAPSDYNFGNLGGSTYYNTRASSYRKGVSLAYSFTNRSYNHRAMATYSTGLTKKGWALTVSGSRRWADEGVIDGTYQDSYAYFLSLEKRLGEKHVLDFTAFGAPTRRASNSPNTQEVYDLMGKNYNSYWGWQDGEKRNERIRKVFEPVFQLSHYWKIGTKSNLNTTLSYQTGSDSRSRLDWFNAASPSPTYYKNLPSYVFNSTTFDTSLGGYELTEAEFNAFMPSYLNLVNTWRTVPNYGQINWENLYKQNARTLETGARYYLVDDVNEDKTYNINTHFDTRLMSNWKLNVNLNYQKFQSEYFRKADDLLGANFVNNLDDYASDGAGYYDVDNLNTAVKKGEKMEYDYNLFRQSFTGNISSNININRWNVTASINMGYSESQREGLFRHYLYLNDSKGKSKLYSAWEYGLKARIEYSITGKDFIVYDGTYFSLAPTLNEIFSNPRLTNVITPDLKNTIINSNDLSFIHRGQILKLRLSGYYTDIYNSTEISRYYAEGLALENSTLGTISNDVFVSEITSNAHKNYFGGELGIEIKISPTLSATGVASVGQYTYKNNPNVYLYSDNIVGVANMGQAYLKDYHIAGTPQQGYSLGFRYNSPKYWWFGFSGNALIQNYLDISSLPRTSNFVNNPNTGNPYSIATPELVKSLLTQKRFTDEFMLNANIGKSFLYGKYRMGVSVSVNNILNNRDYVTGGFEQGRNANLLDAYADANRPIPLFGPKLWYDRGRTYFANVYLRF